MTTGHPITDDITTPGSGCPPVNWQGYILLTVENGAVTFQRLLRPDECVMSLSCFIEMARRAGWCVTPQADASED
ncbi:hypothetical protein [Enterobacter ludwigii]|uniref:hypothetical protein n=1 Tax=Enterobacter ludwigii TaxID=299767 RepID=UPI000642D774|nr:hypothetical protein [Enterobacter ludwigii]KLP35547.1 hypothetical protein ABR36_18490 [Enterobacter ludwigii]